MAPSDRVPVPVNVTGVSTESPVPLSSHVELTAPAAPGEKRTLATICWPGRRIVPSGTAVRPLNPPEIGGLDLVRVRLVPPAFEITNVRSTHVPTGVDPKSIDVGVTCNFAGLADEPVKLMSIEPPLLATVTVDANCPAWVGAKVAVTLVEAPGPITVPDAGAPCRENGAAGADIELMVRS